MRESGKVEHRRMRRAQGAARFGAPMREFVRGHRPGAADRARARLPRSRTREAWWLDDYAMFLAIRGQQSLRPWWEWPAPLARSCGRGAGQGRRRSRRGDRRTASTSQWIAAVQWSEARRRSQPVQVFGDLPFMISGDSPDVWMAQAEFRFDATVGVPPDAFSETGQDWGLPPWRWEVMARNDFAWMRRRARRSASLFDGFRLDHLVGLYRTYIRPIDPSVAPFFAPPDEPTQLALGEYLVKIYLQSGAEIIAEDLGTVPDMVRESLQRLEVPGFKVLSLGARVEGGRSSRSSIRRGIRRFQWRRPARTTPSRWSAGGRSCRPTNASASCRSRPSRVISRRSITPTLMASTDSDE